MVLFTEASKQIKQIHIFSRTSPAQKGIIVGLLNLEGHQTLMCGDGTNDVGSLKRADVGLAIVNGKEPTKEAKAKRKQISAWPDRKKMAACKSLAEQQEMMKKHQEEYMATMKAA